MKASQYPDLYPNAFEQALENPVTLVFSTHAKAMSFRVELYRYRWAVRDELPKSRKHYDKLTQVKISVRDKKVILQHKKRSFMEKLNET